MRPSFEFGKLGLIAGAEEESGIVGQLSEVLRIGPLHGAIEKQNIRSCSLMILWQTENVHRILRVRLPEPRHQHIVGPFINIRYIPRQVPARGTNVQLRIVRIVGQLREAHRAVGIVVHGIHLHRRAKLREVGHALGSR